MLAVGDVALADGHCICEVEEVDLPKSAHAASAGGRKVVEVYLTHSHVKALLSMRERVSVARLGSGRASYLRARRWLMLQLNVFRGSDWLTSH